MIQLLQTRRSIRKFQDSPISPSAIENLKEALLRSPSSRGKNPWEFIFINDKNTLKVLSHAKSNGGEFLEHATLGIVICGDETISDVWIEDCSIAAILVQLAAHAEGLGSCWVQIRNRTNADGTPAENHIRRLLNIPDNLRVLAIVGVGVPAEKKQGILKERLGYGKIHVGSY